MHVADLNLPEATVKRLDHIYRMVGRRDCGLNFDPAAVPVFVMAPLVGDYIEYLKESGASEADLKAANEIFDQLCEVA